MTPMGKLEETVHKYEKLCEIRQKRHAMQIALSTLEKELVQDCYELQEVLNLPTHLDGQATFAAIEPHFDVLFSFYLEWGGLLPEGAAAR